MGVLKELTGRTLSSIDEVTPREAYNLYATKQLTMIRIAFYDHTTGKREAWNAIDRCLPTTPAQEKAFFARMFKEVLAHERKEVAPESKIRINTAP